MHISIRCLLHTHVFSHNEPTYPQPDVEPLLRYLALTAPRLMELSVLVIGIRLCGPYLLSPGMRGLYGQELWGQPRAWRS